MKKIKNMIIDKIIKIKINAKNYKNYKDKGYIFGKCGEEIEANVEDLPINSHTKINCKCDNCGVEKKITYGNYNLHKKLHNIYTCYKCCNIKGKLTDDIKYGCDHRSTKEFKEKCNKTILEKYGSKEDYSNFIRIISQEKCIEKYGVENVFQLDGIKMKSKKTMLDKYGVEHALQNLKLFEKSQNSSFKLNMHNGIIYQGTYELDFLKFCENNNIKVERGNIINYLFNGDKKYYPDYYLPKYNLICEIKSSYYYERCLNINLIKREYTIKNGFNFLFIVDKNYKELEFFIKEM